MIDALMYVKRLKDDIDSLKAIIQKMRILIIANMTQKIIILDVSFVRGLVDGRLRSRGMDWKDLDELQNMVHDIKLIVGEYNEAEYYFLDIINNALESQQQTIEKLKCCGNCGRVFNESQIDGINCNIICKRSELVSDSCSDDYWTKGEHMSDKDIRELPVRPREDYEKHYTFEQLREEALTFSSNHSDMYGTTEGLFLANKIVELTNRVIELEGKR